MFNRRFKTSRLMCIFLLLILMALLHCWTQRSSTYYPAAPGEIRVPSTSQYLTNFGVSNWRPEKVKKILLWTPYFDTAERVNKSLQSCSNALGRCEMTNNKSELQSSSAVLFHADDLWGMWFTSRDSKSWRPQYRDPRQVWVMMTLEATTHMWGWFPPNFFNWTFSYRRDSTILHTYGLEMEKSQEELHNSTTEFQNKRKFNYFGNKTKMAAIHVSNCADYGRRYKIIRELSKYIEVDEFGHCSGNIVCNSTVSFDKCMEIFKPYKFYLAFENAICRDYITEKFWLAQTVKWQIPVISASKHTIERLPPKSYLNVFDFPSIKDLADEMIRIGNNATLFNGFFDWKDYYKPLPNPFCTLCNALHENRTAQSYHDMEAWIQHDTCSKPTVSVFKRFYTAQYEVCCFLGCPPVPS